MANYYKEQYEKFGFKICEGLYGTDFVIWLNTEYKYGKR